MQKYNTSPPHFFRKALTKRRWCVIIVKSAKQFAHTACGILPCEQKKAENPTKAEQKATNKIASGKLCDGGVQPARARGKTTSQFSFNHIQKLNISRCSAVGSAPVSGTGGLEFESPHFDQKEKESPRGSLFLFMLVWVKRTSLLRSRMEFAYSAKMCQARL